MIRIAHRFRADRYSGMTRSTRFAMIAGIAVFLTLVSSVSFAAWTATSTKSATASTGAVALSTATTAGASTITALGPYTYTATNQTVTKPITVRNTGSVDASVTSIVISRSGTLGGAQVTVKFWVGTSSACAASTPVVSTTLSGGTVSLSTLNLSVAATGSAILCASTTFTGSMTTQAGRTTDVSFALNSSAGTNWNTTDSLALSGRSFTQSIFITTAPNAPTNLQCTNGSDEDRVTIAWSTPSGFTTPNGGYNIYYNGSLLGNVTTTSAGLTGSNVSGTITVRAVASDGTESADSSSVTLEPRSYDRRGQGSGIACG
ncbi:fibronectin type III domain-containing protein [Salinibacterium sp. NK8237]|uniref:fibronectin type III domain-containing protein n=1 Tax=Salinibacterium sp. NK8237 TaxID=2792038 RepID=UPI0018CD4CD8|nr:fibronectin type III domain-containing protein [Salinibacterium sp. NK8237]MBH0129957.1 hypothetical protein [Salinibacterium sp. NK8237]